MLRKSNEKSSKTESTYQISDREKSCPKVKSISSACKRYPLVVLKNETLPKAKTVMQECKQLENVELKIETRGYKLWVRSGSWWICGFSSLWMYLHFIAYTEQWTVILIVIFTVRKVSGSGRLMCLCLYLSCCVSCASVWCGFGGIGTTFISNRVMCIRVFVWFCGWFILIQANHRENCFEKKNERKNKLNIINEASKNESIYNMCAKYFFFGSYKCALQTVHHINEIIQFSWLQSNKNESTYFHRKGKWCSTSF